MTVSSVLVCRLQYIRDRLVTFLGIFLQKDQSCESKLSIAIHTTLRCVTRERLSFVN